tara:strand:+ start:497 stop:721 length:225 start_codon:yes stop_codon:yes gene_type:complete
MRLYFIIIYDGTDTFYEYHSSIAKAKKSRTKWNRVFKENDEGEPVSVIFKTDITPTKKGFIDYLNNFGGGTPIE